MYGYIYLTTNLINNKKYVGRHKASKFDTKYFGSGTLLKEAIKKYGVSNFKVDILEVIDTDSYHLDLAEIYWIKYFDATNSEDFYNRAFGGYGNPGHNLSDAEKMQRSAQSKLNWQNSEYRDKMMRKIELLKLTGVYNTMGGKHHSIETKLKMSASMSGERNPNYGKHFSQEHREKLSMAKKLNPTYSMTSEGNPMNDRIWVSNGDNEKAIIKEDLDTYLHNGYSIGRLHRNWITNGLQNKHVLESEIDYYLLNGWKIGRTL